MSRDDLDFTLAEIVALASLADASATQPAGTQLDVDEDVWDLLEGKGLTQIEVIHENAKGGRTGFVKRTRFGDEVIAKCLKVGEADDVEAAVQFTQIKELVERAYRNSGLEFDSLRRIGDLNLVDAAHPPEWTN